MKHIKIFALAFCLPAFMAAQNVTVHKQGGVGHAYRVEQVDSVVYFPIGDGEQFPAPEEENTKSLWDIIKAQPNLKKFAAILEAANYFATDGLRRQATNQKLCQVLDGSLPLNVYAPTDAAISDAEYDRLLSLAKTDGWKLQQEFAFNHISPQEGGTAFDGNTVMLNGKRINANAHNPIPASGEAAEGKLFTVSAIIPYLPSMKEYLQVLAPDCTQAQTFMAGLKKVDTDADASILAIPTRGGEQNTLLSIISETDPLASQYLHSDGLMQIKGFGTDLADESATYMMVTPTDAVWNDARAKLSSHYQYASRYEDKIQGDMGLGKSYIDIANPDSITALSMGADILVPLLGKTTEGQQTKLCNGTAFAATEWPVPASEYKPDVEVEIEHSGTTTTVLREADGYQIYDPTDGTTLSELEVQKQTTEVFYNTSGSGSYYRVGADAACLYLDNDKFSEITDIYGRVSNNNFYYFSNSGLTTGPRVEIKLQGKNGEQVMSGKYDIQVVTVPYWYTQMTPLYSSGSKTYEVYAPGSYSPVSYTINNNNEGSIPAKWRDPESGQINQNVIDSLAILSKQKFSVSITYNNNGTEKTRLSLMRGYAYDGLRVDTITVAEDFEFPTSYKNVHTSYPVLYIECSTSKSDIKNGFIYNLCIDKIILRSKEDGSEIYYAPQTNRQTR